MVSSSYFYDIVYLSIYEFLDVLQPSDVFLQMKGNFLRRRQEQEKKNRTDPLLLILCVLEDEKCGVLTKVALLEELFKLLLDGDVKSGELALAHQHEEGLMY
jgi:hypothetical protein